MRSKIAVLLLALALADEGGDLKERKRVLGR
jgi:hypothetical protein